MRIFEKIADFLDKDRIAVAFDTAKAHHISMMYYVAASLERRLGFIPEEVMHLIRIAESLKFDKVRTAKQWLSIWSNFDYESYMLGVANRVMAKF